MRPAVFGFGRMVWLNDSSADRNMGFNRFNSRAYLNPPLANLKNEGSDMLTHLQTHLRICVPENILSTVIFIHCAMKADQVKFGGVTVYNLVIYILVRKRISVG